MVLLCCCQDGAVGFHDRKLVIKVAVDKDKDTVKRLEKTRSADRTDVDFSKERQMRNVNDIKDKKQARKVQKNAQAMLDKERRAEAERLSYE